MKRIGRRTGAVVALALLGTVTVAACSSGSSGGAGTTSGGHVTITVGCEPPKTEAAQRSFFIQDVASFEKANPDITIVGDDTNPCDEPTTFDAKLASGKMDDVFYTYFTDAGNVINSGQAADIEKYASQIKNLSALQPALVNLYRQGGSGGDLYGVPVSNYTLGLLYNRALFTRAGLNPNQPPATWAQVRADARKISALGGGIAGYGDYSAANVGGWHFTAELYSLGGSMVTGNGKRASFDNATGMQVLRNLQQMRWADNSMGAKQLLQYNDLPQMMGSGKLGMYVAAPDNVTYIHQEYGSAYGDLAMGPMPGGGTLLGGDGYMFNKKDTQAQIEAGIKFLNYEFLTPGAGQFNFARTKKAGQPVGLPEPNIWRAGTSTAQASTSDEDTNATIPVSNFQPYLTASPQIKDEIEPPQAQAIYAQGDKVMAAVLTQRNPNLHALLASFASQVNTILANSQQ